MESSISVSDCSLVQCPCQEFGSLQSIRVALESEKRTNALVAWLSDAEGHRLSCQPQQPDLGCTRRVGVSFSILNGIRDVVRPFLEPVKSSEAEPSYEESFPSLDAETQSAKTPNVLVARGKTKKKTSPATITARKNDLNKGGSGKRRVRLESVPASARNQGNIVRLASTPPPTLRGINISPSNEWPEITVGKKQVSSDDEMEWKKPKQRITLAPATGAWGSTKHGNMMSLLSSDSLPAPTKASSDEVKKTLTCSVDEIRNETAALESKSAEKVRSTPTAIPLDHSITTSQTVTPFPSQTKKLESDTRPQRQKLARVYSSLVLNHLVPSTALELHLLIRLLTANEQPGMLTLSEDESHAATLQSLFTSSKCCKSFSIDVFARVKCILRNLPLDMIEGFVNCPPFASALPDLTGELKAVIERRKDALTITEVEAMSIVGGAHSQMPLLTLPFDHDRDSRHNYTSRDDAAVYKNREESRDAFLYQLRAFQNIRGKVVDATQAERSVDRIRAASRNVIHGLLKSNMCWFAQLFCELLIQIGLVPMEETDKELLKIAGKDKLQKLHKRFSAKGTQASKSSKNLVLDPSKSVGTASPVEEVQQYFPGHQEFFFIFILTTDCYTFNVHLKNRLTFEINKLLSSSDTMKGFEKRLFQLKLLSRFLGLLIFSPSWHDSGLVGGSHFDLLSDFNSNLDVVGIVDRANREGFLVTTIPWVVEFLRMARWAQKSGDFKRLLAVLLRIRHHIRCDENKAPDSFCVNMQLVSIYLETLFGDIIGLERSATVPVDTRTTSSDVLIRSDKSRGPDECSFRFSNSLLFTSNPHTEELFALLSSQTQTMSKAKSNILRKMTPFSFGGSFGSSSDPLGSPASLSPMKAKKRVSLGSGFDQAPQVEGKYNASPAIKRLVEAFFHQHQDLKTICEFVVDQTLKNVAIRMRVECVLPLLEKNIVDVVDTESSNFLDTVEKQVTESARSFLLTEVGSTIPAAVAILCPTTIQLRVREVATKLSIAHAIRLGEATIESLVRLESKKVSLGKARQLKKKASAADTQKRVSKMTNENQAKNEDVLVAFRNALANHLWERRLDFMVTVVGDAKEAILRSENGSDVSNLGIFQALDLSAVPLLQWCLQEDSHEKKVRWNLVSDFLGVTVFLCGKSTSRTSTDFKCKISSYFSDGGRAEALIDLGLSTSRDGDDEYIETTSALLHDLTRCKLIRPLQLEFALIRSLHGHDKGRILCRYFATHEHNRCIESNAESEKSLEYTRLREELEKQIAEHANQ